MKKKHNMIDGFHAQVCAMMTVFTCVLNLVPAEPQTTPGGIPIAPILKEPSYKHDQPAGTMQTEAVLETAVTPLKSRIIPPSHPENAAEEELQSVHGLSATLTITASENHEAVLEATLNQQTEPREAVLDTTLSLSPDSIYEEKVALDEPIMTKTLTTRSSLHSHRRQLKGKELREEDYFPALAPLSETTSEKAVNAIKSKSPRKMFSIPTAGYIAFLGAFMLLLRRSDDAEE
jgi:hypothetical protein